MNRLRSGPSIAHLSACYAAYLLAAAFGQWMMLAPGISITVWPPNGVMLAVLLANSPTSWPWWIAVAAAGELTANFIWFANPLLPAIGYVAVNALEVVVGALLLARLFHSPEVRFNSLGQLLVFIGIGVLLSPVIGATLGSAIDAAVGKRPFLASWPFWWLGDATGILIATPLVISAVNAWRTRAAPSPAQLAEGAAIAVTLAGLGYLLFAGDFSYAFVLFVPVIWAALRFEMRGATLAVLAVTLLIGLHTRYSAAQAVGDSLAYRYAMLQLLILVVAATGYIVAVIIRQYRHTLSELALLNSRLEQRVIERTGEIKAAEQRFKATFENAAVGMSILDGGGRLMRVNGNLAAMLGYPADVLEGRPLDEFTHPADLASSRAAMARLTSGAADHYVIEKRYVGKHGRSIWGHTSVSCIRKPDGEIEYLIKVIQDITARHRSDEVRQLLMHELNHRSKNMLATIQAIARLTVLASPHDFMENFAQRLQSMAASQDLLVKSGWEPIGLDDLVHAQLAHLGGELDDRFEIQGRAVLISARVAQAIGMALHELGTNAIKYGSLSNDVGRVAVTWSLDGDDFSMSWCETGGPQVAKPTKRGFGTTVIETMVEASLAARVTVDYQPSGLVWRLQCRLSDLEDVEPAMRAAAGDQTGLSL